MESTGPNGLAFDATYGVEVSAWEEHLAPPPPPRTFALALTLDTSAGVYRTDFFRAGQPWTFALDAAVRVDF